MHKTYRLQPLRPIRITEPNHIKFRLWLELYRQRFPVHELAPSTEISKSLTNGNSVIDGLFDSSSGQWAAFTLVEYYGEATLLAYLATSPDFEGQGLAKRLVDCLLSESLKNSAPYFFLEAKPKLWKFYKKLGFMYLDMPYRTPSFIDDSSEKMGLFLCMHPSVSRLDKSVVESFISDLLLNGYGIHESDPRYQWQMQVINSYPQSYINLN